MCELGFGVLLLFITFSHLIYCFEGLLEPLSVLKIMIPKGGQNLNGGA